MDNFISTEHSSALETDSFDNFDMIPYEDIEVEDTSLVKKQVSNYIDKKALLAKIDLYDYVKTLCPDAKIEGKDIVVLNPTRHDTKLGSFRICLYGEKKGCFNDFADSYFKGKGIIDLTMLLLGMDFYEALEHIFFFATGKSHQEYARKQYTVPVCHHKMMDQEKDIVIEFKGDATQTLPKTLQYNKQFPTKKYIYTDINNDPIVVMSRYDTQTGKHFLAQSHTTNNEWVMKLPTYNRPLYNLHAIHTQIDNPIIVVEGEKTADTLQEALPEFIVTTTLCGANAVDKSDLSPLYNRDVYLWGDNDTAGFIYTDKIKYLLNNKVKRLFILDEAFIIKHSQGYDAVDYLKKHTVAELYTLIATQFNEVITVKQKHRTQKEMMLSIIEPLIKDTPLVKLIKTLITGPLKENRFDYVDTERATNKVSALKKFAIQINTNTEYKVLILDITYSQYGKSIPSKNYLGRIGCLPTPNFIVRERKGFGLQYVYLLERHAYGKMMGLVKEIGDKLAKLAGVCRETVEIIPKATLNTDGFMLNPLTQVIRWYHNDTFTLSQLNDIGNSTQAIFFSRDNTVYFNAIRKIAYRAVNYVSNLHIFLNDLSKRIQAQLGIDLYLAEEQMILKSIVQFVIKHKASFKHRKYTLSKQDESLFASLTAKEKQQAGAQYSANRKRNKRQNQLLLFIKNLTTTDISQKEIAKALQMSDSNLSMRYKKYLTQLLKNKVQQLTQRQWLNTKRTTQVSTMSCDNSTDSSMLSALIST